MKITKKVRAARQTRNAESVQASEDYIVDVDLDKMDKEWWEAEEKRRLAREIADEEDAYDLEHGEGVYSCDTVQASSTRDRISDLEERIAQLEEGLKYARATGADDDVIIDYQLELDELRDELNFAWQDDEAEYNYALEQQEFNPDGSLKYYSDDIEMSTDVECSEDDNDCPNCHFILYNVYSGESIGNYATLDEAKEARDDYGMAEWEWHVVKTDWDNTFGSTQVDAQTSIKASEILPNKKIQKGMVWWKDGHAFEVQSISKDGRTCKISEDWLAEDSGKECHNVEKYNIVDDGPSGEYAYLVGDEEYAKPGQSDYRWWARTYATGADNYPWDAEEMTSDVDVPIG